MLKERTRQESKVFLWIELTDYYKTANKGRVALPSHIEALNAVRNFWNK